jgi:hypothetical protein
MLAHLVGDMTQPLHVGALYLDAKDGFWAHEAEIKDDKVVRDGIKLDVTVNNILRTARLKMDGTAAKAQACLVGQTRDTTADDGSSFHETLTALEPNKSFGYKVENLTSPAMKGVVDRIEGAWEFTDNGNGTTSIEWFYVLVPANREAVATIKEKILARYRGRLENAMNIIKADLEQTSV